MHLCQRQTFRETFGPGWWTGRRRKGWLVGRLSMRGSEIATATGIRNVSHDHREKTFSTSYQGGQKWVPILRSMCMNFIEVHFMTDNEMIRTNDEKSCRCLENYLLLFNSFMGTIQPSLQPRIWWPNWTCLISTSLLGFVCPSTSATITMSSGSPILRLWCWTPKKG